MNTKRKLFQEGIRDGIPISLGYLAVSFSLGVAAKNAGLNALQGFLVSFLNLASAGEYAGFTVIAANGSYVEIILMTLIANARYLLMSCALSQRFSPKTALVHRLFIGYAVTDEIFGVTISRPGMIQPVYNYGVMALPILLWSIGTSLGVIAGNLLPLRAVSALSVALYGMFLAVIVPPARKNKVVAVLILISFVLSFFAARLPLVSTLSGGTRTIILTVLIAGLAALLFPVSQQDEEDKIS